MQPYRNRLNKRNHNGIFISTTAQRLTTFSFIYGMTFLLNISRKTETETLFSIPFLYRPQNNEGHKQLLEGVNVYTTYKSIDNDNILARIAYYM